MAQNAVVPFEDVFNKWRDAADRHDFDIQESQHEYWMTITHADHPERGVLHVRLIIPAQETGKVLATGIKYWGATLDTPWERLNEAGATTVFGIIMGSKSWHERA